MRNNHDTISSKNCDEFGYGQFNNKLDSYDVDCRNSCSESGNDMYKNNNDDCRNDYRIFVGGLDDITSSELSSIFSCFGEVVKASIVRDRRRQRQRGFAFITFKTQEAMDRSLESSYVVVKNRVVEIKKALSRSALSLNSSKAPDYRAPAVNDYKQPTRSYEDNINTCNRVNANNVNNNAMKVNKNFTINYNMANQQVRTNASKQGLCRNEYNASVNNDQPRHNNIAPKLNVYNAPNECYNNYVTSNSQFVPCEYNLNNNIVNHGNNANKSNKNYKNLTSSQIDDVIDTCLRDKYNLYDRRSYYMNNNDYANYSRSANGTKEYNMPHYNPNDMILSDTTTLFNDLRYDANRTASTIAPSGYKPNANIYNNNNNINIHSYRNPGNYVNYNGSKQIVQPKDISNTGMSLPSISVTNNNNNNNIIDLHDASYSATSNLTTEACQTTVNSSVDFAFKDPYNISKLILPLFNGAQLTTLSPDFTNVIAAGPWNSDKVLPTTVQ